MKKQVKKMAKCSNCGSLLILVLQGDNYVGTCKRCKITFAVDKNKI